MRNIIQLAHVSLDGFLAGPGGDMSFITMDSEIGDHVYPLVHTIDTSIYGRVTYQLMEGYWPSVLADKTAGAHEAQHARWYADVKKIVASRTLPASRSPNVQIVSDDIVGAVAAAKRAPGGNMMIFASPSVSHTLAAAGLIDEWRLFWQPVILGAGLRLFGGQEQTSRLRLASTKTFSSGVVATHHVCSRP